jgi:uroporphyrin-III C-methyltransferase
MNSGEVVLIGAGPGHPDFITVAGLRALQSAEVVLEDALIDPLFRELYAPHADVYYAGKRCGRHSMTQDEINGLLLRLASEGKKTARLKGGDPFVFGRGGEEALFLRQHGIPVQIIPGVSTFASAGALCGIPLTHRGISDSAMLINGHNTEQDWEMLARYKGTIVVFMGAHNARYIAARLLYAGAHPDLPAGIIRSASLPEQTCTVSSLSEVALAGVPGESGPCILYFGQVVNLKDALTLVSAESFPC